MGIEYTDYDRITDTLMYLSDQVTLDFIMNLSNKRKSGERSFFHTDIEFNSEKYLGKSLRSIKRNMNFYFVINVRDNFGAGFIIRPQDKELLTMFIEKNVLPWFFDRDKYAFQTVDNKLALKEFQMQIYTQSDTKYLTFEPSIYAYSDDTFNPGIKMTISGIIPFEMNIDKFMGFYCLLKNTDMYNSAINLANYVKIPPYGINEYKPTGLGASRSPNNAGWNESNYKGRGSNSFLDSI